MKSFLNACGLEESLQLVVESQRGDEDELRLLQQPFAVIGRDPRADVVLDHSQVSRRHVYLQVVEGRAFWVDLESRTGTRGEHESERSGWLEDGKTLWVGPYFVRRFMANVATDKETSRDNLPRDTPLVALAYSRAQLPEVTLEFLNGPSQSMSRPVHRVMSLIGSASGCKFRLTDPSVSRFHASLLRTSAGLWIVDLLGHSGISVNEKPVRFDRLADGDVVRIGRYQIRVQCRFRGQGLVKGKTADPGYAALTGRLPRREHASRSLSIRNWGAVAIPFEPRAESGKSAQVPVPMRFDSSSPKVEVMPSNTTLSGKLAQADGTESALVPLVNQFGMMQQQMFDQFQQAIAMMVQMFGEMHRDQMEVIREELGRLHELTDEFNALRTELASRSGERSDPISSNDFVNPQEHRRPLAPEPNAFITPSAAAPRPLASRQPLNDARATQTPLPSPGSLHPSVTAAQEKRPLLETAECSPTQPLSTPSMDRSLTSAPEMPGPPFPPKSHDTTRPAADSDRDTVVWLHQRIAALQQERESRWQKILRLLPGMS